MTKSQRRIKHRKGELRRAMRRQGYPWGTQFEEWMKTVQFCRTLSAHIKVRPTGLWVSVCCMEKIFGWDSKAIYAGLPSEQMLARLRIEEHSDLPTNSSIPTNKTPAEKAHCPAA